MGGEIKLVNKLGKLIISYANSQGYSNIHVSLKTNLINFKRQTELKLHEIYLDI